MSDHGMRLGPWRIERILARDLSGAYYAAARATGTRATLYLPSKEPGARVRSPAQLLVQHRALAHPALVRFYDLDVEPGTDDAFLIGEPIDAGLAPLRGAHRPDAGQIAPLGAALADALAHAHARGVAHGGLELDHVLWAPEAAPRLLGLGATALVLADRAQVARGDVAALGRLLCALVVGEQLCGGGGDSRSASPAFVAVVNLARRLADPIGAFTMREAYALLAVAGPARATRGTPSAPPRRAPSPSPASWSPPPPSFSNALTEDLAGGGARGATTAPTESPTVVDPTPPSDPAGDGDGDGDDELASLQRYRVLTRLGRGGMGEVLLAEDPALRRGVAIKRIRPGLERDRSFQARLRREAQLAARLGHRAIVQVFDLVTHAQIDHLVMEYVSGPSLHALLVGSALRPTEAVRIAAELADGLAYAHHQGVIHRDLKLENILLGIDGQPKIADFGVARRTAADSLSADSLTGRDVVVGTLRAMAPEQLIGHDVDARGDLFSFGVMLYELVTGTSPFAAAADVETMHRVVYHRQPPAHAVVPAVPRALSALIDQLLEKDPAQRPASAQVVRDRLRRMLDEPGALIAEPAVDTAAVPALTATGMPVARAAGSSRIQAPFVLAEIRALRASIFKHAPEVRSALAVADKIEHTYDLQRSDLFIPATETFCAVLAPFSTTVLTGTLRRIGYEIFPKYLSILGIPAADVKSTMQLHDATDLVRFICDAYAKCVVGSDAGTLRATITGAIATVTDTTFMPCQLQIGVFLGAGKLTGLFSERVLSEKRCRARGDAACVYELAF